MTTLPENWSKVSINKLNTKLKKIDFDNLEFWDFINLLKSKPVQSNVAVGNYIFHKLDNEKQDSFIKIYNTLYDKLYEKYSSFWEEMMERFTEIWEKDETKLVIPTVKDIDYDGLSQMSAYIVSLGEKKYSSIMNKGGPFRKMLDTWENMVQNDQSEFKNEFLENFASVFQKRSPHPQVQ